MSSSVWRIIGREIVGERWTGHGGVTLRPVKGGTAMASDNSFAGGADAILRQLDAEADSTSVEVTLYLPWGMATGITVPGSYFRHYVAHFFAKNNAGDIAARLAALDAAQGRG